MKMGTVQNNVKAICRELTGLWNEHFTQTNKKIPYLARLGTIPSSLAFEKVMTTHTTIATKPPFLEDVFHLKTEVFTVTIEGKAFTFSRIEHLDSFMKHIYTEQPMKSKGIKWTTSGTRNESGEFEGESLSMYDFARTLNLSEQQSLDLYKALFYEFRLYEQYTELSKS